MPLVEIYQLGLVTDFRPLDKGCPVRNLATVFFTLEIVSKCLVALLARESLLVDESTKLDERRWRRCFCVARGVAKGLA